MCYISSVGSGCDSDSVNLVFLCRALFCAGALTVETLSSSEFLFCKGCIAVIKEAVIIKVNC